MMDEEQEGRLQAILMVLEALATDFNRKPERMHRAGDVAEAIRELQVLIVQECDA
jgi:hypothetical protein